MKYAYILIAMVLLLTTVFATDAKMVSIDNNQFYSGHEENIIIDFDANDTNGNISFYDGIESHTHLYPYVSGDTQITVPMTYNTVGDRNLEIDIRDSNNNLQDTNIINNTLIKTITIKKGIDLEITDINTVPTTIEPNTTAKIYISFTNKGDEDYVGTDSIDVFVDNIKISNNPFTDLLIDATKIISLDWTPDINFSGANIKAKINPTNTIQEYATLNNEKIVTVSSTTLGNLVLSDISVSESLRKNFLENIGIVIENNGGRPIEGALLEIFIDDLSTKVYSNTISVNQDSSKVYDFLYSFPAVKEYKIIARVNYFQEKQESTYSDNTLEQTVQVYDFNLQEIMTENETLQRELIEAEGKYNLIDVERQTCLTSLRTTKTREESCASNLSICNSNNNTKISNYMVGLDANRDSEKTIYLGEISQLNAEKSALSNSYDTKLKILEEEKDQWAMLVVIIMVAIIGLIFYTEYMKQKPKRAVGISGS